MGKQGKKVMVDTITLGYGHSSMTGNLPKSIDFNDFNEKAKNIESVDTFGLWGGSSEYNTYYPDVKPEEFTPSDSEFIEPVFRLLSETVVARGSWRSTDFSKNGVLKKAMKMLLGQTVNCDHETNIGNAIGSISEVYWQDSYTIKKDGKDIVIPAGINGKLKIDAKANPRLARGIMMDPPSIHSNSVTVRFTWEKSHPDMSDDAFYNQVGSYDKDGNLICRIVTGILNFSETSLVSHGADPYAQKIDSNGSIVNPVYASRIDQSLSATAEDKEDKNNKFFMDFKESLNVFELHNTSDSNNEKDIENQDNINNMEELEKFLDELFGSDNLLKLEENEKKTKDLALLKIKAALESSKKVHGLEEELSTLKSDLNKLKPMAEIGESRLTEVRESTLANYKKTVSEDKVDTAMVTLIEGASLSTLSTLNKNYKLQLETLFPLSCKECGSTNVSRGSAATKIDEAENKEKDTDPYQSVIDRLNKKQTK